MVAPRSRRGAIVVFVKTPGISPVKTRLAQSIGEERARAFYLLSVKSVEETVISTIAAHDPDSLMPYWAIAESNAMGNPLWKKFKRTLQGEGALGDRLNRVYRRLRREFGYVIFLGADCPQIPPETLSEAAAILKLGLERDEPRFVMGRALDGGYYLFGGNAALPPEAWTQTPYSVASTASTFAKFLKEKGTLHELQTLFDVDTAEDLARLASTPLRPTSAHQALATWMSSSLGEA